jgi:hypothetical protein
MDRKPYLLTNDIEGLTSWNITELELRDHTSDVLLSDVINCILEKSAVRGFLTHAFYCRIVVMKDYV